MHANVLSAPVFTVSTALSTAWVFVAENLQDYDSVDLSAICPNLRPLLEIQIGAGLGSHD